MKPIKPGYKLWCLSNDMGYIYKTIIYTGKGDTQTVNDRRRELGLGGDVVMSLLDVVSKPKHKVFFDNYFSSIPLIEILKSKDILACGTIRNTRKDFPQLLEDKCMKRGDFDYRSTPQGITVYKWKDSKSVNFISNYHGVIMPTVQRKEKDGSKVIVSCPDVVSDYNEHMGGVDKHDMLRNLYGTDRKYKKWWHRIFFGIIDMAIINTYLLYVNNACNKPITLLNFYREVAQGLMTFS